MDVDEILAAGKPQRKSTDVEKEVELQLDLGNLVATDLNSLDTEALRKSKDDYMKRLVRDNTQIMINKIWELPVEKSDGFVFAKLPEPTTVLPREKPIPKPRPPTKWELFAKSKGIRKTKRSRMVFDEKSQEWKPRWGYKRINDPKADWMMEVPDRADPLEDQFEKKAEKRKEIIAKNEYQRLKNIAQSQKGAKVKVPLPPPITKDLGKHELTQALGMAKVATASLGKFTPSLPKEPVPKRDKKQKFATVVGDSRTEKQKNLDILDKLSKGKAVLDVTKAANAANSEAEKRKHLKRKLDGGGKEDRRGKESKPKRRKKAGAAGGGRVGGGGGRGGGGGGRQGAMGKQKTLGKKLAKGGRRR